MEKIKEQKRLHKLGILLRNNLNICFLVFMILFGVLFAKKFTSPANLQNLLKQMSVNAMLATGFSICFIADGFDLSQGNVCSACGCVALSVLINTGSWLLAMGAALLVGLLFGMFNALVCKVIKGDGNDSYIVTLATSMIALGFAYIFTNGGRVVTLDNALPETVAYRIIAKGKVLGIPYIALLAMFVMLVGAFILKKTKLGRRFYLVGANKTAAYMSGINSHNYRAYAFMISGLCVAFAAIAVTARNGNVAATTCAGYENDAAIATIVGGNAAGNGKSGMVYTLIGVLSLGILSNVMTLMHIDSVVQTVVKGIILIAALYAQMIKAKNS